jgi:hypothetical protein
VPCVGVRSDTLGNAEIADLYVPMVLQEDVARLDVTVQYPQAVRGVQRTQGLGEDEDD